MEVLSNLQQMTSKSLELFQTPTSPYFKFMPQTSLLIENYSFINFFSSSLVSPLGLTRPCVSPQWPGKLMQGRKSWCRAKLIWHWQPTDLSKLTPRLGPRPCLALQRAHPVGHALVLALGWAHPVSIALALALGQAHPCNLGYLMPRPREASSHRGWGKHAEAGRVSSPPTPSSSELP